MSKKKTERIFKQVHSISEYLSNIESHGDKIIYSYLSGKEYVSLTYRDFCDKVYSIGAGLRAQDPKGNSEDKK